MARRPLKETTGRRARTGRAVAGTITAGLALVALARVLGAPARDEVLVPVSEEQRRAIVDALGREEPALRAAAAAAFPGDRWSADDDFHHQELALVRRVAAEQHASVSAVWDALDLALHAPPSDEAADPRLRPTVARCHPRPRD